MSATIQSESNIFFFPKLTTQMLPLIALQILRANPTNVSNEAMTNANKLPKQRQKLKVSAAQV